MREESSMKPKRNLLDSIQYPAPGNMKVSDAGSAAFRGDMRKKVETILEKANAYNRSLIEASLDPLVTISPDGTISDVNEATIRITGFTREELIGTDFSDYFTNPERQRQVYEKVFRDGSVTDYPLEIRHRDGHVTPVLYNAAVYRDVAGNGHRCLCCCPGHHRAEESRRGDQEGECIQPEPDRGEPGPAGHHQP